MFVDPVDELLFRDARPFSAGESHRAAASWPPTPLPFAGTMRAVLIQRTGLGLREYTAMARSGTGHPVFDQLGTPRGYGRLRMIGPFPAIRSEVLRILFETPRDLGLQGKRFRPRRASGWGTLNPISNLGGNPAALVWADPASTPSEMEGTLLPGEGMWKYLVDDLWTPTDYWVPERATVAPALPQNGDAVVYKLEDLFVSEPRTGIELEPLARKVQIGRLYLADFRSGRRVRSNPTARTAYARVGFAFSLQSDGDLNSLISPDLTVDAPLGGERKGATLFALPERPPEWEALDGPEFRIALANQIENTGRFKLVLAQPAIFHAGWRPAITTMHASAHGEVILTLSGSPLAALETAIVGKPRAIGGWDLVAGRPRCLHRAVPAGSVYFFTLLDRRRAKEVVEAFHLQSAVQRMEEDLELSELAKVGFGTTLVGGWSYQ